MIWARICRTLGLVGILLFGASAFTPLPNLVARWDLPPARLEPADAIVVLGGEGVAGDGILGSTSLRRAIRGIVLYRQGLAPLLVLLGSGADTGDSEAAARADLARRLGVSSDAILMEDGARTTRQEAERIRDLLRPRGVRRILLVTDSQHMTRARGVFERAGFEVLPVPAEDEVLISSAKPEDRLQLFRWAVLEFMARLYYRAAGYL